MKHIILSIQPQWLAKILNGEKTVEIRKSVPKLPCTVWLYCTKGGAVLLQDWGNAIIQNGIPQLNGKIVAKFVLEDADQFAVDRSGVIVDGNWFTATGFLKKVSISQEEMFTYAKGKPLWAWHISNLTILDKPLSLGDFESYLMEHKKGRKPKNNTPQEIIASAPKYVFYRGEITRAPQSWQYVVPKGE